MTQQEAKKYFKNLLIQNLKDYLIQLPSKDSDEYKLIESQVLNRIAELEK